MSKIARLSKAMKRLDERLVHLNEIYEAYLSNPVNPYGHNIAQKEIRHTKRIIDSLKPKSEFEELFLRNSRDSVNVQSMLADYLIRLSDVSTREVVDEIYGPNSYELLERAHASYDWKTQWKVIRQEQEVSRNLVPYSDSRAQKKIAKMIGKMKAEVLSFAIGRGYLPKRFDFQILVLSSRQHDERSYWNEENKRVWLSTKAFVCTDSGRGIRIDPTAVYYEIFHEAVGHGGQSFHLFLPASLGLRYSPGNVLSKSVREGLAVLREDLCTEFLSRNYKRLGINRNQIEDYAMRKKMDVLQSIDQAFHRVLKERELREEGFDILRYVERVTGNKALAARYTREPKPRIEHALSEFGYYLGYRHLKGVQERLLNQFGRDSSDVLKVSTAMCSGAWSRTVYEDAIKFMFTNSK